MESFSVYIPTDRRHALARGESLPDRTEGAVMDADISGFTPLTAALTRLLGPRLGSEELTRQLNRVYDALIDEVDRHGGSVTGFSGDAITCWFDAAIGRPALRAVACGLAMQSAMRTFAALPLPNGETAALAMKVAIGSGPARRFLVGNASIQLMDTLAGETVVRMATGEHLAQQGEVLVDVSTVAQLGTALQVTEWRTAAETGDRFALVGGLAISPADVPPPPPSPPALPDDQAAAWVLPPVAERLREGLGEFLTEFRPAVALFLRFEGIDYEGDEGAGHKLDAYVRWVQGVLARYEGSLIQLTIGDKGSYLYASFGAPLAHEDDARRAASAALDLRAAPGELSFVRSVQIGLSQGTMRAGAYGGMTRRTYGALGDEVNLAARLMQHAGPGEVLVSGRVQKVLAGAFALEALPPIRVKGKSDPVAVARLLGQQQARAEFARYAGAIVGREAEVAQLTECLQPILAGRFAGLVYVYGEPGIGKSRLVYEVRQRFGREHGVSWFTCPAEGILRQSLHPFQHFLREYFDQNSESPEEKKTRFESVLHDLLAYLQRPGASGADGIRTSEISYEVDRTRSFLGALAGGLHWEGSLYERLEPKLRFENTLTACKALVLAETLRQPVVLYFEDAHWLDSDTEALLRMLTRNVGPYPLAVVLTSRYRDDGSRYSVNVDADVPQTAIDLNQLSPAGIRGMAEQVLGGRMDDEVAGFLAEKTSGNPFFVEQLALDLRERGMLATQPMPARDGEEAGHVVAFADPTRVEEVPEGVNAVLVARLDRLAAQVKAVVQTASVLGQEFEVLILSHMLEGDERVHAKVKQAEAEAIWSALTETRYLFKHALLRDAAYDMQLQARLRELHALAGAALERVYAAELSAQAAALAYHWGVAGDGGKEAHYSVLAGQAALRTSAFRDALRYFQRALALLPGDSGRDNQRKRSALNYGLGEAHGGLGNLKESQECFQTSLALARTSDDRKGTADALSLLGGVALRLGEAEQAETYLREGLAIAREIGDEPAIANALLRLGHIAFARGAYLEALRTYEEGLALARLIGDQMKIAGVLNGLGLVAIELHQLEAAQRRFEEAQSLLKPAGNRTGVVMALGNLGTVASRRGQHGEAKRLYGEALALSFEIGDRRLRADLLDNLGDVAYELGDDDEAARYFRQSLALTMEVGVIPAALLALAGIARLRARARDSAHTLELLGLALDHPASDDQVKHRAEPLLAELQAALPSDVFEAALARGRAKTLEAMASEVLQEI